MKKKIAKKEVDTDKQERVLILASRVELLFGFCAELIPDKDLLRDVMKQAGERVGHTMAMEPILGAFGMDGEAAEFEARLKADRAQALFNLIDVLDRTESERIEFGAKQGAKAEGRAQIARALGL